MECTCTRLIFQQCDIIYYTYRKNWKDIYNQNKKHRSLRNSKDGTSLFGKHRDNNNLMEKHEIIKILDNLINLNNYRFQVFTRKIVFLALNSTNTALFTNKLCLLHKITASYGWEKQINWEFQFNSKRTEWVQSYQIGNRIIHTASLQISGICTDIIRNSWLAQPGKNISTVKSVKI